MFKFKHFFKSKNTNTKVGYKYRSVDGDNFEKNLNALENNFIWASQRSNLNDPFETLVNPDKLRKQIKQIHSSFNSSKDEISTVNQAFENILSRREKVGVFSLSKSAKHELLWAYYASSHKGFCIEFNLELLVKKNIYQDFQFFPVKYEGTLPKLEIKDASAKNQISFFQKLLGTKSKSWSHEEELRIITDSIGENYYDFLSVSSIYFGYRMTDFHKSQIMKRLKGRGIKYFQILLEENSYNFSAQQVKDSYESASSYLFETPRNSDIIKYKIIKKSYDQLLKKGSIKVVLESKIQKLEIEANAWEIKNKLFKQANILSIGYMTEKMIDGNGYWAIADFDSNNLKTSITGLSIEHEKYLKQIFENETRNSIGSWIDETPYVCSGLTLIKENEEISLETYHVDESKSTNLLDSTTIGNEIRYDFVEENTHGEYLLLDSNGVLKFFDSEGKFKELNPFLLNSRF